MRYPLQSRLAGLVLGLAMAAAWAGSAGSLEIEAKRPIPAVVVSFEGGMVGDNVSKVLAALAASLDELPTERYVVQPGDTLCGLLDARHYPQPCTRLAEFVDSLNPATRPSRNGLKVGDTLVLPAIEIQGYQAANSYSTKIQQQAVIAQGLTRTYAKLNPRSLNVTPDRVVVEYKAYELRIPVKDDAIALALAKRLGTFQSPNVFVDVLRSASGGPTKLNSAPALTDIQAQCTDGTIAGSTYRYADLSDADGDALAVVRAGLPAAPETVSVFIVDVPLAPSPNLAAAGAQARHWTCRWQPSFKAGLHHATHLAGIIASRAGAFGFAGLAPNAKLRPFTWATPDANGVDVLPVADDERLRLADIITDNTTATPPPIYLAAADFDLPVGLSRDAPLPEASMRFAGKVSRAIQKRRPLFIVAAGQVADNAAPHEISEVAPLSPQYFGDQENVVVVTACSVCDRNDTRLMASANFSRQGAAFVHVAAPGGSDIPGWISAHEIGAARGTSQAAAYVAGIAAAMIGNFPDAYGSAFVVKTRLQVTSRPLPATVGGLPVADQRKLAAGVVDPILALLDPNKDWLKDATGWREVKLKAWPAAPMVFSDAQGKVSRLEGAQVLRMLRVTIPGGRKYWSIYTDLFKIGEDVNSGSVGRVGPVLMTGKAGLTLCDGTSVDLDTVEDFIPSQSEDLADACPAP